MNNLSRHKTVLDLSQEGLAAQENVDLTVTSPDISDLQIFMIAEAISRSLQSSFKGLKNTLGSLSKDIHKLASDYSSKHALWADEGPSLQSLVYSSSKHAKYQADARISTSTPESARLRAGVMTSQPKHANSLPGGSPPSTLEGGGSPEEVDSDNPLEDEDDILSLHPHDQIQPILANTEQLVDNKFRNFHTTITKTTECLATPLHEDIATCFNAMYNTSLQDSKEVKNLLSDVHKPANIDMIVRPTNSGVYTLKDQAMYAIRNVDARLQEVQTTIAKSSYENMKLAEE